MRNKSIKIIITSKTPSKTISTISKILMDNSLHRDILVNKSIKWKKNIFNSSIYSFLSLIKTPSIYLCYHYFLLLNRFLITELKLKKELRYSWILSMSTVSSPIPQIYLLICLSTFMKITLSASLSCRS
jgi:hypothetical protein